MNNTRQVMTFKINCQATEANELINKYLEQNNFILTEYNGEQVLKLNNLWSKQSFYKTYIKIYLNIDEITIIGWIKYKDKEYGFDDTLDLKNTDKESNWQPTKELYSIFFTIAYNFKQDDNVYCEKMPVNNINIPQIKNIFVPTLPMKEDKTYVNPKTGKIILFIGLALIMLIIIIAIVASILD